MSATERRAVPGLTPVSDVLSFEGRLSNLEAENAELRQMLREQAYCMGMLNSALYGLRTCIRIAAQTDLSHNDRLARLEEMRQGDLRLSEVLGGIETRLKRVELGGEVLP